MAEASSQPTADATLHDGVAVLRLESKAGMNAFDPAYLSMVRATLTHILGDDEVRAVVVTGSGPAFSTGADVRAMHKAAAEGTAAQWVLDATAQLHPVLHGIHVSHKPFVAAVGGVAAGGGLGLALACDARIGSPAARFAAGYFGIGLSPDGGATWLLPRLIGPQRTRRFFFDNEVMDADEALRTGLLDAVVPAERLLDEAVGLARRWGAWSRHSLESTKRLLAASDQQAATHQMDMERGLIAAAAATAGFREGTTAFVEKRPPSFS